MADETDPGDVEQIQQDNSGQIAKLRDDLALAMAEIDDLKTRMDDAEGKIAEALAAAGAAQRTADEFTKWRAGLTGSGGIDIQDNQFLFNGRIQGSGTHKCVDGKSVFNFDLQIKAP